MAMREPALYLILLKIIHIPDQASATLAPDYLTFRSKIAHKNLKILIKYNFEVLQPWCTLVMKYQLIMFTRTDHPDQQTGVWYAPQWNVLRPDDLFFVYLAPIPGATSLIV